MKLSSIPHGLALAAALVVCSSGASAASGEPRALSESEMSQVYGRGLSEPALTALGALTTQEQSSSAIAAASPADALAALGAVTSDSMQNIDRQMAQQRLQSTASNMQATVKIADTLAVLSSALAPIAGALTLPTMTLPLFGLPALSLDAIQKKH